MPKLDLINPWGSHDTISVCAKFGLILRDVDDNDEEEAHRVAYHRPLVDIKNLGRLELDDEDMCTIPWQAVQGWTPGGGRVIVHFKEPVPIKGYIRNFLNGPVKTLHFQKINLGMKSFWPRAPV